MIKLMVRVSTSIWMELDMKEIGTRINSREMEKKFGKMGLLMKANIKMVKSMEKENFYGQISQSLLETLY
jgi:hypothetical protein